MRLAVIFLLLGLLAGCTGNHNLVVLSKEIQRAQLNMSVAGDQFGSGAGSTIENIVAGQIQNQGDEDIRDVELTFHVAGGGQNYALVAYIPNVPAGKTVSFQTRGVNTHYTLTFKNNGEADIAVGKKPL